MYVRNTGAGLNVKEDDHTSACPTVGQLQVKWYKTYTRVVHMLHVYVLSTLHAHSRYPTCARVCGTSRRDGLAHVNDTTYVVRLVMEYLNGLQTTVYFGRLSIAAIFSQSYSSTKRKRAPGTNEHCAALVLVYIEH
jgi:hypothetical protein